MRPNPSPGLEPRRIPPSETTGGERAFQALLACAFLKQQMELRLSYQQLITPGRRLRSPADAQNQVWGREFDEVLSLLADRTLAITGANGAAIALAERRGIVCRARSGNAPGVGSLIDPESGFSGLAILTGEILRCDDTQSDGRVDAPACAQLGIRSLVAVPLLRRRNSVVGLLEVFSDRPHAFGDREMNIIKLLAGFILEALQSVIPPSLPAVESSRMVAAQATPLSDSPAPAPVANESILDESAAASEAQAALPDPAGASGWSAIQPDILAAPDEEDEQASAEAGWHRLMPVVITIAFLAAIVAIGFAWKHFADAKRNVPAPAGPQQKLDQIAPPAPRLQPASATLTQVPEPISEEPAPAIPASKISPPDEITRVTEIRHWSTPQSSTIVIELQREVSFLSHRLHAPERIYYDLHATQLAPELKDKTFVIADGIVDKIRVASPQPSVSRVVLDTAAQREYTTTTSTQPYRIIIEVRK